RGVLALLDGHAAVDRPNDVAALARRQRTELAAVLGRVGDLRHVRSWTAWQGAWPGAWPGAASLCIRQTARHRTLPAPKPVEAACFAVQPRTVPGQVSSPCGTFRGHPRSSTPRSTSASSSR